MHRNIRRKFFVLDKIRIIDPIRFDHSLILKLYFLPNISLNLLIFQTEKSSIDKLLRFYVLETDLINF